MDKTKSFGDRYFPGTNIPNKHNFDGIKLIFYYLLIKINSILIWDIYETDSRHVSMGKGIDKIFMLLSIVISKSTNEG